MIDISTIVVGQTTPLVCFSILAIAEEALFRKTDPEISMAGPTRTNGATTPYRCILRAEIIASAVKPAIKNACPAAYISFFKTII